MKLCGENNINSIKYYESFQNENEFVIVLELCDYGLNKIEKYTLKISSHQRVNYYMAPEIMKGEKYNYKCDLWSLGIIIYELYFKERPYKGDNKQDICEKIEKYEVYRFQICHFLNSHVYCFLCLRLP